MREKVIAKMDNVSITLIWYVLRALPAVIPTDSINLGELDVIPILPGELVLLTGTKPVIARKV